MPSPAAPEPKGEQAYLCVCGHIHAADADGEDAGCRVCECVVWRETPITAKDAKFHQRPPLLAVDGDGYVWRVFEEHGEIYWSMCPVDSGNQQSPEPITYYVPIDVTDRLRETTMQYLDTGRGDVGGALDLYDTATTLARPSVSPAAQEGRVTGRPVVSAPTDDTAREQRCSLTDVRVGQLHPPYHAACRCGYWGPARSVLIAAIRDAREHAGRPSVGAGT